ncbi:MAG: hypothetical protein KAR13_20005, partial [Desulfobulbaceae bacterium]|nr:hypothetical protein [Desulfobulbaceae bacterium]
MPVNNPSKADAAAPVVTSRHVFYMSGFDPRGPAYYHRLYKEEAARQTRVAGMQLSVGKRQRSTDNVASWDIAAQSNRHQVCTSYDYLHWDDIVRSHWPRGEGRLLLVMLRTFWTYIHTGVLRRVLRTSWPVFITTIYPPLFLLAVLGCAVSSAFYVLQALPVWDGVPAGMLAFYAVIRLGRFLESRNNAFWLLRLYAFFVDQSNDEVRALEARLDAFATRMLKHIEHTQEDEILIIGHSTGAQIAVSLMSRMLRINPGLGRLGPRVALLTLGECIPMLSFLPGAKACREDLALVSSAEDIDWLDFTAPSDGACFALVDPVRVSGVETGSGATTKPKLLSPRFFTLFSPGSYSRMKRNRLRMHFQYLMAGEIEGDYDYFAITAGPVFLGERYGNFKSS